MAKLIITNGEAARDQMRAAGLGYDILCWRDILHEGPVPETQTLEELSAIRAQFLAERGWSEVGPLLAAFAERDAQLRNHTRYDTVIVWLEHDLYDQLQLLQVLDFFASEPRRDGLCLIQAGRHLGQESPSALKRHLRLLEAVTPGQLELARLCWRAFRSPTPMRLAALLQFDITPLPFLRAAILRQLEELPAPLNGLTRTEDSILRAITQGLAQPRDLFADYSEGEEAAFMADWSFWHVLDQLSGGHSPLVAGLYGVSFSPQMGQEAFEAYVSTELRVTNLGLNALNGKTDAAQHRRIDRWIGGVHLTNANLWRWDAGNRRLSAP